MSYSIQDAQMELALRIGDVLQTRDVEGAYKLAQFFFETGDEEQGETFRNFGRKWEREDNYHDEVNGN